MHLEFLYQVTSAFSRLPSRQLAVVDSDSLKQGKSWRGLHIHPPAAIAGTDWENTKLLVSSYGGQEDIARAAGELGVPNDRIVRLYDEVRVY